MLYRSTFWSFVLGNLRAWAISFFRERHSLLSFQSAVNFAETLFKGLLSCSVYFFEIISSILQHIFFWKKACLHYIALIVQPSSPYVLLQTQSDTIILTACPRKAIFSLLKIITYDACPLAGDNIKNKK